MEGLLGACRLLCRSVPFQRSRGLRPPWHSRMIEETSNLSVMTIEREETLEMEARLDDYELVSEFPCSCNRPTD